MTDLTKIDRPFGLLDEATQKALRECGGPWEYYGSCGWEKSANPEKLTFAPWFVYRQKPQPREWWCCNGFMFKAKDRAEEYAEKYKGFEIIHVREVMPE